MKVETKFNIFKMVRQRNLLVGRELECVHDGGSEVVGFVKKMKF